MNREPTNPDKPPSAEQIAAYVDGELAPAEHSAVGAWLVGDPETMADVSAGRRIGEMMRASRAPEPGWDKWEKARQRIEARLAGVNGRSRPILYRFLLSLTAAAAALVAFWIIKGEAPLPNADEPFPVASFQDVWILSMDPRDSSALVVGHPPAVEPIVLATHEEVTLVKTEPTTEGVWPDIWTEAGSSPMILPAAEDR